MTRVVHMEYKTELVDNLSVINATEKIDEKIENMVHNRYELVTLSFMGTQRALLVFKKL